MIVAFEGQLYRLSKSTHSVLQETGMGDCVAMPKVGEGVDYVVELLKWLLPGVQVLVAAIGKLCGGIMIISSQNSLTPLQKNRAAEINIHSN